jgi:hypothetical protein
MESISYVLWCATINLWVGPTGGAEVSAIFFWLCLLIVHGCRYTNWRLWCEDQLQHLIKKR